MIRPLIFFSSAASNTRRMNCRISAGVGKSSNRYLFRCFAKVISRWAINQVEIPLRMEWYIKDSSGMLSSFCLNSSIEVALSIGSPFLFRKIKSPNPRYPLIKSWISWARVGEFLLIKAACNSSAFTVFSISWLWSIQGIYAPVRLT